MPTEPLLHAGEHHDDRVGFDISACPSGEAQLTLSQFVAPRPIAMISTRSADGVLNVSPYSYFNAVTGKPPLLAVMMGLREDGRQKDTFTNLLATGECVVNSTGEAFRDDIEEVAKEYPADVDEFAVAGWTPRPSVRVSVPGVAEAAASLECRLHRVIDEGEPGVVFSEVHIVLLEVVYVTMSPSVLNERGRVDPLRLGPIGRLGLRSYLRTVPDGVYELERTAYAPDPVEAG